MDEVTSALLRFRGRINRARYWVGSILVGLAGQIAGFFFQTLITLMDPESMMVQVLAFASLAFMLLLFYLILALAVGRLHDRNKPGWWSIPMTVIPFIII